MKDINELTQDLGPVRKREFVETHAAHMAAQAKLAELQKQLSESKAAQTMNEPAALVGVGVGVAELAKGMQLHSAHNALAVHLEKEAIPQAMREVATTAREMNRLVDSRQGKVARIEEQRRIIDKAQGEIDRAQGWLDT